MIKRRAKVKNLLVVCFGYATEILFLPAVEYFGTVDIVLALVVEWSPELREKWVLLCHFIPLPWTSVRFVFVWIRHALLTPVTT